jgi:hypothetical protein
VISRRTFVHGVAGAVLWPLAAEAPNYPDLSNSSWADQSESTTTMTTKGGIVGRGGGLVIWEARL